MIISLRTPWARQAVRSSLSALDTRGKEAYNEAEKG